jgi:hypothetical protein
MECWVRKLMTLVFAATLPGLAAASDASTFGRWCAPDNPALVIDAVGMGGEHDYCEFDSAQTADRSLSALMICRQYHDNGDGQMVETQRTDYQVSAALITDNQLQVDYGDGRDPVALQRCEIEEGGASDG